MQQRELTIRLVRLAMAAALIVPCLLFAFASWNSYRQIAALTDERLSHSLDVQQEEAQKTFDLVDLALSAADDLVAGMSDANIRDNQDRLHPLLEKLAERIPPVQAIWILGKDGRALASSRDSLLPDESFADWDFFKAHREGEIGTYYGQIYPSRFNGQPFFTVSRRLDRDGHFVGVLEVSVLPSNFFSFFSTLASTDALQFALIRADGLILARYPAVPPGATDRLDSSTGFRQMTARLPSGGMYTATSPVDHIERRFAYRRFRETPLYLTSGITVSAMRDELIWTMTPHLIYGIPVTLILFLTLFAVLRRTQRLYAEINRRSIAEEALRQSQKLDAIGHLTGGVAHDFNNLLTIIIGNLESAQHQLETWTDGAQIKVARRLASAMHGAQRAATLTKRLLAFSRQQPLNPSVLDINRTLNGLSDFLRRALGEDVSLEIVGSGGVWPVEADAAELEAAILNLAVNARDAMPDGGKLTIEASNSYLDDIYCGQNGDVRPGQYVQIAVTDTGAGMSKQVIDRAFEPFYTTKQSGQGTGLGLSQVYGFVKQSGGHIKLDSEEGRGTTVKIYLPRTDEPSEPDERKPPSRQMSGNEAILVVEDDALVRSSVIAQLRSLGYRTREAVNATEALKLVDAGESFDLLFSDIIMPGGMNGQELAAQVASRYPAIRVLLTSGQTDDAAIRRGLLHTGAWLLSKPYRKADLARKIREVLDEPAPAVTAGPP